MPGVPIQSGDRGVVAVPRAVRVFRRDATAAVWAITPLVLGRGEEGRESDTGVIKYGDGIRAWPALPVAFDPRMLTEDGGKAPVVDDWPDLVVMAEAAMA